MTTHNNDSSITNFIPLSKIGEGSFSSVYKVKRINDQQIYALKKIKISSLKQKQRLNALNEIRILASIESKFIITYKEAFFDEKLNLLCIVMELANEGDLYKKISEYKQKRMLIPEEQVWKAAYQIISGLNILHQNNILHRDLKSANIFLGDGTYKLGDLNVSKVNSAQSKLVRTQTGTPYYASPQVWRDEPYGNKSDIWSFGCILYEMCCGRPPFFGEDLNQLYKNVQKGYNCRLPRNYSAELDNLIRECLRSDAKQRPSTQDLLRSKSIIRQKCQFYEIQIDNNDIKPQNGSKLLSTIKMPQDMKDLKRNLPDSRYHPSRSQIKEPSKSNIKPKPQIPPIRSLEDQQKPQQSQIQQSQKLPLPIRIKNHLKNINEGIEKVAQVRRIQSSKYRIANNSCIQQQKELIAKKLEQYLTPIKDQEIKKRRPVSCNYLRAQPPKQPYYLQKLTRPSNRYNSDRKPLASYSINNSIRVGRTDRKDLQDRYKRYNNEGIDQNIKEDLNKDKLRCRSANLPRGNSSIAEIRKRLQNRSKNMKINSMNCPQLNIQYSSKSKSILKTQQMIPIKGYSPEIRNLRQVYSGCLKRPNLPNRSIFNQAESYLADIQNKIANSGYRKHINNEAMGVDSRIRRVLKSNRRL